MPFFGDYQEDWLCLIHDVVCRRKVQQMYRCKWNGHERVWVGSLRKPRPVHSQHISLIRLSGISVKVDRTLLTIIPPREWHTNIMGLCAASSSYYR